MMRVRAPIALRERVHPRGPRPECQADIATGSPGPEVTAMKVAMFDIRRYDQDSFEAANERFGHQITFLEPRLTVETAMRS